MAGTAQAKPLIMGITLLPFKPTFRINLSVRKLIRAIYPVSSKMVINPNRIIICGIKITIPLSPATTPLISRSLHQVTGKLLLSIPPNWPNTHSMPSIGYLATQKTL